MVVGGDDENHNEHLRQKGLAASGNAQDEARLVHQQRPVNGNQVPGDGIDAEVQSARVLNFLHLEGHEDRQGFRIQRAVHLGFPGTKGQDGIQAVHLLEGQGCNLAQAVDGTGNDALRFPVQFFLGIGGDDHADAGLHHTLVPTHQVMEELLGFLVLHFQIIGHGCRKIIVGVLPPLPVGHIGFNGQ